MGGWSAGGALGGVQRMGTNATQWRPWFAWRPVKVDGEIVWGARVERREIWDRYPDEMGLASRWVYRKPTPGEHDETRQTGL